MKRLLLIVGLLPLLCFGQANTYRDISWLINRNAPSTPTFIWTNISGCRILLQSSTLSSQGTNNGNTVHTLTDTSGNSNTFTNNTSGTIFTNSTTLNTKPAIDIDGSLNACLFSAGNLSSQFPSASTSIFIVWINSTQWTPYSSDGGAVDSYFRYGGDGNGFMGLFRSARIDEYPSTMPSSGAHVVVITSDASSYHCYLDGVDKGSQSAAYSSGASHIVGRGAGVTFVGQMADIAIYDNVLDSATRKTIENYASTNYGISVTQ